MHIQGTDNIDGGISIDLSWLNQTVVSPDRSTVSLGTGRTWYNTYDNLAADKVPLHDTVAVPVNSVHPDELTGPCARTT